MAINQVVAVCRCPLCNEEGAEVRRGEKGRLYIVCDDCVSMVRTQSRAGQSIIATLANATLVCDLAAAERDAQAAEVGKPAAPVPKAPAAKAVKRGIIEAWGLE